MGAGEDAQGDDIHVFLNGGFHDLARCLPETGVDHLHARVHEGICNDLDSAVMTVQSRFGSQHPYFSFRVHASHSV